MIIYRPHRGNLSDAMKEAKEFNDIQEMKNFIINEWENNVSTNDIVIDNKIINDHRIGWQDTKAVCTRKIGQEEYEYPQCIGFCATVYTKSTTHD